MLHCFVRSGFTGTRHSVTVDTVNFACVEWQVITAGTQYIRSVGTMNSSESWDVNRHTMPCTSLASVISQCKLVSG